LAWSAVLVEERKLPEIKSGIRVVAALTIGLGGLLAQAQMSASRSISRAAAVEYLFPEQVTVPAGKPASVALHFRIAPGLHINSHTPGEEELIPTTFSIPEGSGVRLDGAVYPSGTDFRLPLDPKTKLSVYTGEFTIQARLVAAPGDHLVEAKLRYQACDNSSCMPPKTIIVAIDVIGK
jgi:DsbC/DsbD-like thiol-disulfide interchange protein